MAESRPDYDAAPDYEEKIPESVTLEKMTKGYKWKIRLHRSSYGTLDELLEELERVNERLERQYGS